VDSKLQTRYLADRVKAFPKIEPELITMIDVKDMPSDEFQHLLYYDAESTFWLLLWWCILAQPAEGISSSVIAYTLWSAIVAEPDGRDKNFIKEFPSYCLDPSYSGLVTLLDDMSLHLQGDLNFSKIKERKEPEYMHEAFQRLILNFLVTNEGESFVDLKKDANPRCVKDIP
jgi:hypothetical protein